MAEPLPAPPSLHRPQAAAMIDRMRSAGLTAGRKRLGTLSAVVAVALAGFLAFPPVSAWLVAWLIPGMILLAVRGRSIAGAALVGGACTAALALSLSSWIPAVIGERFGGSLVGSLAVWGLAGLAHAPAGAVFGGLCRWVRVESASYPVVAGLAWGSMELSWEVLWPGVPWVVLGATQIETPLAPLASGLGVYGISAIVGLGSAAVFQGVFHGWRLPGLLALGVTLIVGATANKPPAIGAGEGPRVAVIQPGVAMPRPGESTSYQRQVMDALIATSRAGSTELVLWPEGALLDPLGDREDLLREIQEFVNESAARLFLGVADRSAEERWNAIALLGPGEPPRVAYHKRRLVPFSEAWPPWVPRSQRHRLGWLAPIQSLSPGGGQLLREAPPFDLTLCWESAFSAMLVSSRAGSMVNLVNDGWYDQTPAAEHIFLLSRWRAIEHAALLVRGATTGISAVVGSDGAIQSRLPVGAPGSLTTRIPIASVDTPFERLGYAPMLLGLGVLLALVAARKFSSHFP